MKGKTTYRFTEKDLYTIILQNNKKTPLNRVKSRLSKLTNSSFRNKGINPSAPYRVTFGVMQSLMQLKSLEIEEEGVFDIYEEVALKKMSTIYVDGMSICGLGYSPLWLLAILNELTQGNQAYDQIIQEELRKYGLLSVDESYETIIELLESFHDQATMDKSLFDHETIGKLKDDIYNLSTYDHVKLEKMQNKLLGLWERMHRIGKYENFSVNKINGIITINVIHQLNMKGIGANNATLSDLFDHFDDILYEAIVQSINALNDLGKKHYLLSHIKPFIEFYLNKEALS